MANKEATVSVKFTADLTELHATRDAIRETERELERLVIRMAQARAEIEALEMKLAVDEMLGPEKVEPLTVYERAHLHDAYDAAMEED